MIKMVNDDLGSRVRRIALNSIGFGVIAGLIAVTAYAGTTSSEEHEQIEASTGTEIDEEPFEALGKAIYDLGNIDGKREIICLGKGNNKHYDKELCDSYSKEWDLVVTRLRDANRMTSAYFSSLLRELKQD